jgi:hypothetical protein
MSQARPMAPPLRVSAYLAQTGHVRMTSRQARQARRMALRTQYRRVGHLPRHGGTGIPVRRPLARSKTGRGVA